MYLLSLFLEKCCSAMSVLSAKPIGCFLSIESVTTVMNAVYGLLVVE
ncbi:hypothetical protein GLIP_3673 [Aliiglaciecola lipolytica E3]|uniref:Uncharacterized protein n=1 Tax=Aliiglaciecola lipolytica E3 TaxID=1127673 RepID=K6X6R9_9ALTE|nr:hypothetical protein GLIP_3673 [Aliiglaciecola lipolytica E3]